MLPISSLCLRCYSHMIQQKTTETGIDECAEVSSSERDAPLFSFLFSLSRLPDGGEGALLSQSVREHSLDIKRVFMNIWYINSIIMESQMRVSGDKREAHRLVKNNFRRDESGSSVIHVYDMRTHWMIQLTIVFLPPISPGSSGQSRTMNGDSHQRRTLNCGYVTMVKCRKQQHRREGLYRPQQSQH